MKNNDILEITNIKINLPSKTIELTAEEARKVYEELDRLFGHETITFNFPKSMPQPCNWPIKIDIDPIPKWQPPYWEVTCNNSLNVNLM